MKKILVIAILIISIFDSCVKAKYNYMGESEQFLYTPSGIVPVLLGPPIGGIARVQVNGMIKELQCVTPSNPTGDVLILDAPMVPKAYEWNANQSQYLPIGFQYNEIAGFSSSYCKGYFVEIFANGLYTFHKGVSIPWGSRPNPSGMISSFEYPNTWVNPWYLPYSKRVTKASPTKYLLDW